MPQFRCSHQQLEGLRDVSQQGLEQAAAMLARLLRQPVGVEVDEAWMSDRLPAEDHLSSTGVGVAMHLDGQLSGGLLLFFPQANATWLSEQLLRRPAGANLLDEPASSTLKEVGNILASAFLANLDSRFGLRCLPSPPELLAGTVAPLLDHCRKDRDAPCLILRTRLFCREESRDPLQGTLYLFPEADSLRLLLRQRDVD